MTSMAVNNSTGHPDIGKPISEGGQVAGNRNKSAPADGVASAPADSSLSIPPASLLHSVEGVTADAKTAEAKDDEHAVVDQEDEKEKQQALTEGMNTIAESQGWSLRFQEYEDTGISVVNIVDSESGELLKTIPAEEFLQTAKRIHELVSKLGSNSGVFVQSEA